MKYKPRQRSWFIFSIPLPIPLTDAFDSATRTNRDPEAMTMRGDWMRVTWTRDATRRQRQETTRHEEMMKAEEGEKDNDKEGGNNDKEGGMRRDDKEGGVREDDKEGGVRRDDKETEG